MLLFVYSVCKMKTHSEGFSFDVFLFLYSGKHIRVWSRFFISGFYRNPSLHSAHSASVSSLIHPNTLTCSLSSDLGSDLRKVRSNCDEFIYFFFLFADYSQCVVLWLESPVTAPDIFFPALLLIHFLAFWGLKCKILEDICRMHAAYPRWEH